MLYVFPEVLPLFALRMPCLYVGLQTHQPTRVSIFRLWICVESRQSTTRQSQGLECTSRWAILKAAPCLSKDRDWRIPWQMETFTQQEENQNEGCEKSKSESDTDVEADVEAKGSLWFYLTSKMQIQRCCHPETQSLAGRFSSWFYVVWNMKVILSTICLLLAMGLHHHLYNLELKPSISTWHSFPRCNLASIAVKKLSQ